MNTGRKTYTEFDISEMLRNREIKPTPQRVMIAYFLFSRWTHMSADEVYRMVNTGGRRVSKATVYNTLGLMAEKGVVRQVVANPVRVVYDPNTQPHYHFYDVVTGALQDVAADNVQVTGLPPLPQGAILEGVDVVIRLRQPK